MASWRSMRRFCTSIDIVTPDCPTKFMTQWARSLILSTSGPAVPICRRARERRRRRERNAATKAAKSRFTDSSRPVRKARALFWTSASPVGSRPTSSAIWRARLSASSRTHWKNSASAMRVRKVA